MPQRGETPIEHLRGLLAPHERMAEVQPRADVLGRAILQVAEDIDRRLRVVEDAVKR